MFNLGDVVRDKRSGKKGIIAGDAKKKFSGVSHPVQLDDGHTIDIPDTNLEKEIIKQRPMDVFKSGTGFLDYKEYRQYMTYLRMKGEFTNVYYSMKQGNIESLPYQMKPVFKFIESNDKRLLIADEVGLGKTVEALLIWKDLEARTGANRLIIFCPAMLCEKWERDMRQFFGIEAEKVNANQLLNKLQDKVNRNKGFVLIASITSVRYKGLIHSEISDEDKDEANGMLAKRKLAEFLEQYRNEHPEDKLVDLIVFDEAHYLSNNATANYKTAKRFSEISKGMLLLSATPINGKTDEFFNLLTLLSPDQFFNKKEFRSTYEKNKSLVALAHLFYSYPAENQVELRKNEIRDLLLSIRYTDLYMEDSFFTKVEDKLDKAFDGTDEGHQLRMKIYDDIVSKYFYSDVFTRSKKRDVLKCATRTPQTVKFKLSKIEKAIYDKATRELRDKLSENGNDEFWAFCILARQRELTSCIPAAISRWKEIGNIILDEDEKSEFELLHEGPINKKEVARTYPENLVNEDISILEKNDSKFNLFLATLKEKLNEGEKIIVFSFFRGTLKYLERRLKENGIKTSIILGGMKFEDKDREIERFRKSNDTNVLLSSEVGAEGIDLQFARIEFNYDLPWNPMRLEQRIGRIDRIGQKSDKIFIVNFSCTDTVEDRVLDLLYSKIKVCEETIGEIDDILGEETSKIQLELLKSDKSEQDKYIEQQNNINRLANEQVLKKQMEENIGLTTSYNERLIELINAAEQNHRYLIDADYEYYICDFFSSHGNGSSFKPGATKGVWELRLSADDEELFKNFLRSTGRDTYIPRGQYISCTLPSSRSKVSSWKIDVSHPLIKWINSVVEKKHLNADCYIFHLDGSKLKEGFNLQDNVYVFYVSALDFEGGLKVTNELTSQAVGVNKLDVLSRDDTDYLLSSAIYYGSEAHAKSLDISRLAGKHISAMDLCCIKHQEVQDALEAELKEKNSISCDQRIKRINSVYSQRDKEYRDALDKAIFNKQKNIKLVEGNLNKNQKSWDEALAYIEKKKDPTPYSEEKALGIIYID